MYQQFIPKNFKQSSMDQIDYCNQIIAEFANQGFKLTLRQMYYQFVSRGKISNTLRSYKNLGTLINNGRLAGLIDWDAIYDRTRKLEKVDTWKDPQSVIEACAKQFKIDVWEGQRYRPEVLIEKDALVGIIENECKESRVSYLSCRGYTSQSEMYKMAQRLSGYMDKGQVPVILHLGDHDPSGIDMTRDITDRLKMFLGVQVFDGIVSHDVGEGEDVAPYIILTRLALNRDQIDRYKPPPDPVKLTDTRCGGYITKHGHHSWELDALEPQVLIDVISGAILDLIIDDDLWETKFAEEKEHREHLRRVSARWDDVTSFVEDES